MHTRQTPCPVLSVLAQRLTEHKLPAVRQVSAFQPVAEAPRFQADDAGYIRPGARVSTQEIRKSESGRPRPDVTWCCNASQ